MFENWVVIELMKSRYNQGRDPHFYFYRDVSEKEVDLLLQQGSRLIRIEIKSHKTFSSGYLGGLKYFHKQTPKRAEGGVVIYRGEKSQKVQDYQVMGVEDCHQIMK